MKLILAAGLAALSMAAGAAPVLAQESGVTVRSIRVLAADPEASAAFYEKAFGMSETRRPVNTPAFKEIVINTGSTPRWAKLATSTPIVIATKRDKAAPPPSMAALILEVPDMDKAIAAVVAARREGRQGQQVGRGANLRHGRRSGRQSDRTIAEAVKAATGWQGLPQKQTPDAGTHPGRVLGRDAEHAWDVPGLGGGETHMCTGPSLPHSGRTLYAATIGDCDLCPWGTLQARKLGLSRTKPRRRRPGQAGCRQSYPRRCPPCAIT